MEVSIDMYRNLKPKDYVKPEIKNEKYYLKWSETSFGIAAEEEDELRKFLDSAYDYIVDMLDLVEQFNKRAQNKSGNQRYDIDQHVSPVFELRGDAKSGSFKLVMPWDAFAFVEKEEDIWVPTKEGEKGLSHSQMTIRWELGEFYAKALADMGD